MDLKRVKGKKSPGYPTRESFMSTHRLEIGAIAAGVGMMLALGAGCDRAAEEGEAQYNPLTMQRIEQEQNTPPVRLLGDIEVIDDY